MVVEPIDGEEEYPAAGDERGPATVSVEDAEGVAAVVAD